MVRYRYFHYWTPRFDRKTLAVTGDVDIAAGDKNVVWRSSPSGRRRLWSLLEPLQEALVVGGVFYNVILCSCSKVLFLGFPDLGFLLLLV